MYRHAGAAEIRPQFPRHVAAESRATFSRDRRSAPRGAPPPLRSPTLILVVRWADAYVLRDRRSAARGAPPPLRSPTLILVVRLGRRLLPGPPPPQAHSRPE